MIHFGNTWAKAIWFILFLTGFWLGLGGGVPSASVGQDAAGPIRVACVGDSITQGVHVRGEDSYPAVLGRLLGERYQVRNFGFLGGTVMNVNDRPYLACAQFKEATDFNPNLVIFMLGTNDSKPEEWKHKERFKQDLIGLLDKFARLPAKPKVWLCTPAWVAKHYPGGHDEQVIGGEIVPVIRAVAAEKKLPLIDIHAAFKGKPELFVDGIHPNAAGCAVLAKTVCKAIARSDQGREVTENVLSYQAPQGGWPKNVDTSAQPYRGDLTGETNQNLHELDTRMREKQ